MGCYPSRLPKENATHIVPDALPDYSDPPSHNEHNKYHDADIEDILDDLEETKDLINWLIEHHVWAGSSPAVDYLNFYTAVLNRFKTYKSLQRQGMETDELKKEMRLNATEIIRNFNNLEVESPKFNGRLQDVPGPLESFQVFDEFLACALKSVSLALASH